MINIKDADNGYILELQLPDTRMRYTLLTKIAKTKTEALKIFGELIDKYEYCKREFEKAKKKAEGDK